MKTYSRSLHTTFLLACILLLASCSLQDSPISEANLKSTFTPTVHRTDMLETSTPALPKIPTPTTIQTPTPTLWPTQPITTDNLGALREIKSWGRGSVIDIQKLKSKQEEYLVLTPFGLYWYTTLSPFLLIFMPDVDDFVLSADGHWLAVSKKNGDVEIWSVSSVSLQQKIPHIFPEEIVLKIEEHKLLPFYVGGMAFSPDGLQIAVGYVDGKVELWRIGETAPYAAIQHDALSLWPTDLGLLFELSFSPDSDVLVAFKFSPYINANRLTFWSIPEAKLISVSDAGRYYRILETAYLPDGKTLLVTSKNDSYLDVNLWNTETGRIVNEFGTGLSKINMVDLSATGDLLTLYGSDPQENYYRHIRALPQGNLVENEKMSSLPEEIDLSRIREVLFEHGHYENVWKNDNDYLSARLVTAESMPIQVVRENHILTLPDGMIMPPQLPENVTNAFYDSKGKYVAWCEPGNLNIQNKDGVITSSALPFTSTCDGVAISPQGNYAAVWQGSTFYLSDLLTGKYSKASFDRRWADNLMLSAAFSDDGEILVTSKYDLITVWQVDPFQKLADSGREERYIGNSIEIYLSKDKALAITFSISQESTSDRTSQLLVWRLEDALPIHRINPPVVGSSQPMFTSFAVSPDANLIASGDDFGGIRIWSVQSGKELAFYDLKARPLDLGFTPDGSGLVIILADGTVRLYGVP